MFKEIFTAARGSHNDTWAAEMGNYLRRMKDFMDRANTEMIPHRMLKESQDPTIPNATDLNAKAKQVNQYKLKITKNQATIERPEL